MVDRLQRTSTARWRVDPKLAGEPPGTSPAARFQILVDDTPPSLDRRIAAWCKASWSWLISAGAHAAVTFLLMAFTTSPEVVQPEVFHFSQTPDDETEVAPPTKLEQMNVAAPAARASALPVGNPAASDALARLELSVGRLMSGDDQSDVAKSTRHGGPTDGARGVSAAGRQMLEEVSKGSHTARFFGIEATGKRFVFVVDSSGSMKWAKWRRACRELVTSIKSLDPDQSFCVFFFDSVPHVMFNQRPAELELIKATPHNVTRVRRWMASVSLGNDTLPFAAVRHAISMQPDAVFLLSDGEFHDATLAYFCAAHPSREDAASSNRVVVHTIGFKSRLGQAALQQIASRTGGTYRFIP